ncbi:MAG: YegS/Rv2252/BmrU family lipid kinase [Lachnospiraceae bacterium]|nr:YegS/Rv2252/BmrU family lipid kinase [Lachnospiraceae bacterium]
MKFDVVVNPVGASGRTLKKFQKLFPIMQQSGNEIEVHYSTKEFGIGDICHKLTCNLKGDEIINLIVVGGDGTLNVALNGMEHLSNVRLGYIPAGSGNDLAKGIGLNTDLAVLTKDIMEGQVKRTMDVGKVYMEGISDALVPSKDLGRYDENGRCYRRFHDSTGFGFDAAICQAADASKYKQVLNKLHLGKLIYLLCAIKLIFTTNRLDLKVISDGAENLYKECLLFVAMNNTYEGGGFKFCPDAKNDDGILDLCIATTKSNGAFFKIFPSAYDGGHVKYKEIHMDKGSNVDVFAPEPQWVHTDGEVVCKALRMEISTEEEQIALLM